MVLMNDADLNRLLKRAGAEVPVRVPPSLEGTIMDRVRVDDGRARRWRSYIKWALILVLTSGVGTGLLVGWSLAARDQTHTVPPPMKLFREGVAP